MVDIGHFSLICSWMLALYAAVIGFAGAIKRKPALSVSSANALNASAAFAVTALVSLAAAFLQHDYRYAYVWQHSSNDMHSAYLVSAVWGGMDGSMLLWAALVALFSSICLMRHEAEPSAAYRGWLVPWLAVSTTFFLTVVVFLTNPFRLIPSDITPVDGKGLNPLLQNPSMLIHPVCLYLGFTGFSVPFAYCMAALFSGDLSARWIDYTKRWTLIAWGFLSAGIILGGNWAYIELGWGGFWAWDPVENSSFMPWLLGTAFLHSVLVQQQRGLFKSWNVLLCASTYLMAVFGTFLTRSGIVQSVHAFAETDVGWVFLAYIGALAAFVLTGMWLSRRELRSSGKLQSYLSREAAFLFNNLLFVGICFATFWGVMFPVFSEAITGEKSVVGAPFFNRVNGPLFLALLFLMGAGPLISWRKSSLRALKKTFLKPLAFGSLIMVLGMVLDPSRPLAGLAFGLSAFVITTVGIEFHRAMSVRKELANESPVQRAVNVVRRKPHRYGGFIIHLAVAIMSIAITASYVYKTERDVVIAVGQSVQVGRYNFELKNLSESRERTYGALIAEVIVTNAATGDFVAKVYPERRFYPASGESSTEVDIHMTLLRDVYVALAGLAGTEKSKQDLTSARASFKIFINPLQIWLWFGALLMLFGLVLIVAPLKVGSAVRESVNAKAAEVHA